MLRLPEPLTFKVAGWGRTKDIIAIALIFVVCAVIAILMAVDSGNRNALDGSAGIAKTPLGISEENVKTRAGSKLEKALDEHGDGVHRVDDRSAKAMRKRLASTPQADDSKEPTATPAASAFSVCKISGMAMDESGRPLSNIGIFRLKNPTPLSGYNSARISSFADLDPELLARTDRKGEYSTMTAVMGQSWLAAYDGQYAFPLMRGANPRLVDLGADGKKNANFQLFRRIPISGKVVDHLQRPVQGASIKVRAAKFAKEYQTVLPLKAVSDSEGNYELEFLPEGIYALAAALDGYAEDAKAEVRAGSEGVDFVLAPESGVRGRVTIGRTGEPVAGIMVIATGGGTSRGGSYARADVILKPGNAKTDSKGFFEIRGLNAGLYPVVVAKHQMDGKTLVAPTREVEIPVGRIVDNIDFFLSEGLSISGRIFEKDSAKPIAGAVVESVLEHNIRAVTDSQGNYQMSGIRPRRQFLRVEASGYAMKDMVGYNEQGAGCAMNIHRQLDVLPGQPAVGIDFEMESAAVIMGRVVNPNGEPLAGIDISLLRDNGLPYVAGWEDKYKTDAKGIYKFDDVYAENYFVKATAPGYAASRSDMIVAATGRVEQVPDVVLAGTGATIFGQITNGKGSPVANAVIKVVQVYQRAGGKPGAAIDAYNANGESRSDNSGGYNIGMIGRGEVEIQVSASGYSLSTRRLRVDDLSRKYEEDFVLGNATFIAGVIKDAKDNPLPNAMILARNQDEPNEQSMDAVSSKADGSFRLDRIKEGSKYALEITLNGYVSQHLTDIPAGKEDVAVTMGRCGSIGGKVVDSVSGVPVKDFALFVTPSNSDEIPNLDAERNWVHSPDGSFHRPNLQPGQYRLIIRAPGYQRFMKDMIAVEEDKPVLAGSIDLIRE